MEPNQDSPQSAEPIEIAASLLSPEALDGLITAYILREGTDYGAHEVTHESKLNSLRRLIDNKESLIFFDPNTESLTLRPSKS